MYGQSKQTYSKSLTILRMAALFRLYFVGLGAGLNCENRIRPRDEDGISAVKNGAVRR